jgi:hypothetical protein
MSVRKYFWLCPKDIRDVFWLINRSYMEKGRRPFERYAGITCPVCRKIDEARALEIGIDPSVRVRSRADWIETGDGFLLLSRRAQGVFDASGVHGVTYRELPGESTHVLVLPDHVDACSETFKMICRLRCTRCGRYKSAVGLPKLSEITLPEDPLQVVCPDVQLESFIGRSWVFMVSDQIAAIVKSHKLKAFALDRVE